MDINVSGFMTRNPPVFDSVAAERRHRLERLAGVCRVFGRLGFSEGLLGHVTVRDPEDPALLWANPIGVSFRRIKVSDLVQVNHAGDILVGTRPVNPVGLLLHSALHEARPEVMAVCHAHSLHGKAWSSLGRLLDPISQDACVLFEQQALIREPRVSQSRAEAARFAAAFGTHRVAIQVGAPELWPADQARVLVRALGSPGFGWLSFQTLWDEIVDSDPDLFN